MAKIIPIRLDKDVVAHMNATRSYFQETNECRKYDQGLCRVCGNERLEESPWCQDHFPWKAQVIQPLQFRPKGDGTKVPR